MTNNNDSVDDGDLARDAQQALQQSDEANARLHFGQARRYGFTVLVGNIAQIVLFLAMGIFFAHSWSWVTVALFLGFAIALSYFWAKAEARNRKLIPHGGRKLESFSSNWRKIVAAAGIVLLGAGAASVGLPASWNASGNGGIGVLGIVSGVLLAVSALPSLAFGAYLIRR